MKKNFNEFGDQQLEEFFSRYYNENVKELLTEFDLDIPISKVSSLFPPKKTQQKCPNCGDTLLESRPSKTQFLNKSEIKAFCGNCDHEEAFDCQCENCIEIRVKYQSDRKEKIKNFIYQNFKVPLDKYPIYEELSFKDKVLISILIRRNIEEDLLTMRPLNEVIGIFAPSAFFEDKCLSRLKEIGFLEISNLAKHPNLITDIHQELRSLKFENAFLKVCFQPKKFKSIEELVSFTLEKIDLKYEDISDAYQFWIEINAYEAIAYFHHTIHQVFSKTFSVGMKTLKLFEELASKFSIGQMYNLIYGASKQVARSQKIKQFSNDIAARSMLNQIQNSADRAIANGYDLKPFNRDFRVPETLISDFYFFSFLRLPQNGFTTIPSIVYLENLRNSFAESKE